VGAQSIAGPNVAAILRDLDGEKEREPLPPQFSRLHPLPVAGEALVTRAPHHWLDDCLRRLMIAL
jgi:hypothetical protein